MIDSKTLQIRSNNNFVNFFQQRLINNTQMSHTRHEHSHSIRTNYYPILIILLPFPTTRFRQENLSLMLFTYLQQLINPLEYLGDELNFPLPILLTNAPQQDNTFLKAKSIDSVLQVRDYSLRQSASATNIYKPLEHLYFSDITKSIQPLLNILHKRYPSMILLPQKDIVLRCNLLHKVGILMRQQR